MSAKKNTFDDIINCVNDSPHVDNLDCRKRKNDASAFKEPPSKKLRLNDNNELDNEDLVDKELDNEDLVDKELDNEDLVDKELDNEEKSKSSTLPSLSFTPSTEPMTLRPEFPDLDEQNKRLSLVSNKTESVAKINKNKSLHSSKGNKPNGAILNKKKEKEEPNSIFGVYTPGQAREKLDEIWRLINNHGINPKVKRSMEDIMAKMLQSLEENDQLADKTEELYNIVIADAVKPTSFINQIKFEEFELDRFLYLSNTFVGRFGKALTCLL